MQQRQLRDWRIAARGVLTGICVIVGLCIVAGLSLGVGVSSAAPEPCRVAATSLSGVDGDNVAGVSVDAVVSALGQDHVAVMSSGADVAALAQVAAQARSEGLNLWIVSLGQHLTQADAGLLAQQILQRVHGTVLVLTPTSGNSRSDELSESLKAAAESAAATGHDDDVAAAKAYLKAATAKPFPWLIVLVGVIVLLIIGAVAYQLVARKRRSAAERGELTGLTQGLTRRLAALAPVMLSIESRIGLVDRPDLADRFNRVGTDYTRLTAELAQPLSSRVEVDATTAQVAQAEKAIDDLDRELDTLLPGLEGPTPSG